MVKVMILDRRKQGMSFEAFRDYYENVHAPMFLSMVPEISGYRRNYLSPIAAVENLEGWDLDTPDYDCIVEMIYKTQEDYDNAMAFLLSEAAQPLAEDEENFLDRRSMALFAADPVDSSID